MARQPRIESIDGMGWLQQTFAQRYNGRHRRFGHLFQGRSKAQVIDSESDENYFRSVGNYIHLNPAPARAGLIGGNRRCRILADFQWSSFPLYLAADQEDRRAKNGDCLAIEKAEDGEQRMDQPAPVDGVLHERKQRSAKDRRNEGEEPGSVVNKAGRNSNILVPTPILLFTEIDWLPLLTEIHFMPIDAGGHNKAVFRRPKLTHEINPFVQNL